MEEQKPKNIFETAASQSKAKKEPPKMPFKEKKEGLPPKNTSKIDYSKPLEEGKLHKDPEIDEMLTQIVSIKDKLESNLNGIYEKSGMNVDELNAYLENPNNFSKDAWEVMQNQRLELENKINVALGRKKKESPKNANAAETTNKQRKSKTLGARKNWIQM